MSTALVDPAVLFTHPPCACCSCCEDYCPDPGGTSWQVLVTLDGGKVVGTNLLLVRSEQISTLPDVVQLIDGPAAAMVVLTTPDSRPPESKHLQGPVLLDQLDRAGLTCHHIDGEDIVHVYREDTHVGWTRWNTNPATGIMPAELPMVRGVAAAAHISLLSATQAMRACS